MMIFSDQVKFLVEVLPFVDSEECFALKGGTALNLFIRDLPRLSVDIDLAYLPVQDRDKSLSEVDAALKRIQTSIENKLPNVSVAASLLRGVNGGVKSCRFL